MGFRDYNPGLNWYLTRDSYNGALADLNLGLNPFTGSRYAFAGGNPITGIELDGHCLVDACGYGTPIGGGRLAQSGPIDPGNPSAGYMRNGQYEAPAPREAVEVWYFATKVTAPDWETYSTAYLATLQQWTSEGFRPPQAHCMPLDSPCIGADNLDVTFFAEKLCQQAGIYCPAHPSPLAQGLAAGAAAGMLFGGGGKDGSGAVAGRRVNRAGVLYPHVIDPRTGAPIPYPGPGLSKVPVAERVPWGSTERGAYIKEWYDRGYATPEGGWSEYDIHHIVPREYGGTNDFGNLVPVLRTIHQQQFNPWWQNY